MSMQLRVSCSCNLQALFSCYLKARRENTKYHMVSAKKYIQIPGLSRTFFHFFPGLYASKLQDFARTFDAIPGLSRTFMEVFK